MRLSLELAGLFDLRWSLKQVEAQLQDPALCPPMALNADCLCVAESALLGA